MRFYTVHENPARRNEDDRIVFVPEGFSLGAFLFPLFWALHRRAWLAVPAYVALAGLLLVLVVMFDAGRITFQYALGALAVGVPLLLVLHPSPALGALAIIITAIFAFEANDLRRFFLARRGYKFVDVVAAPSLMEAERRYFAARGFPLSEASPTAPAARAGFSESLGPPRRLRMSLIPGLDDRP